MINKILSGISIKALSSKLKLRSINSNHLQILTQNYLFNCSLISSLKLMQKQTNFYFSSTSIKSEKLLKQLQDLKGRVGQNQEIYLATLNELAITYTKQNNNEKAIEIYKDLVNRLGQKQDKKILLAKCKKALQVLLFDSNKLQESLSYQQELVQFAIKMKGQNSKQAARQYNMLAQICFKAHKIQNAIKNFQKSIQIYNFIQKSKNSNQIPTQEELKQRCQLLINAAYSCWSIGKKQNASQYFIKCRQIIIHNLNKYPSLIQIMTQVLMNLSILKQLQNSFDQSLKYCEELQKLFVQHQKNQGKAELFNRIGKIYLKKRKFEQCQKYLLESQKLNLAQPIINNQNLAQTYHLFANLYQIKGDKPKALESYQKQLNFVKKITKQGNQYFIANLHNSIGNLLLIMKRYEQARNNFKQSETLLIQVWKKKPQDSFIYQTLGDTYYNIGKTFHDQAKFNEAIQWYQKAKQFYEKSKKLSNRIKLINVYRGLGLTYFKRPQDKQKTIQNFLKSTKICQEIHPNHPDLKMQYALIFDSLYSLGKLQQALTFTDKTLAINEHELKINPNNMQTILVTGFQKYFKGLIYYKLNSLEKAKQNLLDAEVHFKKVSFDQKICKIHQNVIYTSILLQELYKIQKKYTQAQIEAKKVENYTRMAFQQMPISEKREENKKKFIAGAKQYLLKEKEKDCE